MMTANTSLWALSLLLESALLAALVWRGAVRQFPTFTALIGFYFVRSVVLFVVFGHLDPGAYELTYTALSSIDLVLQIAVAWELLLDGRGRGQLAQPRRRVASFAALVLISAACSWALSIALPASARTPVDRSVLFTSTLMVAVFATAADRFRAAPASRALQGFAVLGIAGILTQVGRTVAALHRNAHAFTSWSWGEPAAYLAVLVFWLISFARSTGTSSGQSNAHQSRGDATVGAD